MYKIEFFNTILSSFDIYTHTIKVIGQCYVTQRLHECRKGGTPNTMAHDLGGRRDVHGSW